ncbi:hypothetical protein AB0J72_05490 [Dactylosporangium sp. NPDC049742]|uniref:hypothetical protein n=1 Tax=Dactylosporangium sp. NPDC049742 TaxID=3154737 RepID=UPI003433D2F3
MDAAARIRTDNVMTLWFVGLGLTVTTGFVAYAFGPWTWALCGGTWCGQPDIQFLTAFFLAVIGVPLFAAGVGISLLVRGTLVGRAMSPTLVGTVAALAGPPVVGLVAATYPTPWFPYTVVVAVGAVLVAVMTRIARS